MSARAEPAGRLISVNLSRRKGVVKEPVAEAEVRPGLGLVGDAHGGPGLRQVSLLAWESIQRQRRIFQERLAQGKLKDRCQKGYDLVAELGPGSFAENLTVEGLALAQLPLGTRLRVGSEVVLEISKIGKKCHTGCAIFQLLGDCVMPREGVFAQVLAGGVVRPGDGVHIDEGGDTDGE